jgi:hypothetical protein
VQGQAAASDGPGEEGEGWARGGVREQALAVMDGERVESTGFEHLAGGCSAGGGYDDLIGTPRCAFRCVSLPSPGQHGPP